jgi:hypothetical protein
MHFSEAETAIRIFRLFAPRFCRLIPREAALFPRRDSCGVAMRLLFRVPTRRVCAPPKREEGK